MSKKAKLLEIVKEGYPDFNPETDNFEIEFEGGGDNFGSFYGIGIYRSGDYQFKFEGELDMDKHNDFLFEILDESGCGYNWNNAGTTGRIKYNEDDDQRLDVETIVSDEYYGEVE